MAMHERRVRCVGLVACLAVAGLGATRSESRLAEAVKNRDELAVTALLQQRADVNAPLPNGTTALHWAVYWDDLNVADRLIRAGANVNATNRYGATPLWMAAKDGYAEMVEMLLKAGANPNILAVGGEPVLMAAAWTGSVAAVKALLAHGADVNAKESRHGQTPLMWAVGDRDPHPDVAQALLEAGADVHVRSAWGLTPLLFAVRQGDLTSVRLLVKAGANVNDRATLPNGQLIALLGASGEAAPSADTSSALTMAIDNSHYELAIFLLENGADPNAAAEPYPYRHRPNSSVSGDALKPGFTPLHAAVNKRGRSRGRSDARSMALLKALIAHGADPNARTPSVRAPVPLQANPQPAITWVEVGGVTPFWIAANNLDIEAMRFLVANGADPRLTSMEQTTPLMVAAGLGSKSRGPSGGLGRRGDIDVDILKQLLEWGADINAVNAHGQTALHGAAFAAAPDVVQFLVDRGARLDLKDEIGRRPLEVADDNMRDEYRPTLQDHNPEDIVATSALLRKLTGDPGIK